MKHRGTHAACCWLAVVMIVASNGLLHAARTSRSNPDTTSPAAPGSGSSPSGAMSKEEKEHGDRETSPAPSGVTRVVQ